MMRKVALVLALSLVVTGGVLAANLILSAGGGGPMNVLDTGRDPIVWSEPPDLNGLICSSETIGDLGFESEVASDFVLTDDSSIGYARWWGGYYNGNGCSDTGVAPNWNLRFYNDGGCVPTEVIYESVGAYANETSIGCQADSYPLFQYEVDVTFAAVGGVLYWFGAQAANHVYPPQVGRLASAGVINCESMLKCAYLSFPNWEATSIVIGVGTDFSQEFWWIHGVPTQETTWGAVKGLYR